MIILAETFLNLARLSDIQDPLAPVATEILILAYIIACAGFIANIWQHRNDPDPEFGTVLRCFVVIACIALIPYLRDIVIAIFYYFPNRLLSQHAGINGTGDRIRAMIADGLDANQDAGFWNMLKSGVAVFVQMLLSGVFGLIAFVGSIILIPFYFVQRVAELVGFALMPIALACMTLPAIKDKATNYVLTILSVLAWPFGFVLVSIAAGTVLDVAIEDPLPGEWGFIANMLVPAMSALILITGTFSVPLLSYFIFTTGGGYLPQGGMSQMMSMARNVSSPAVPRMK